jgi:predicted transcriptional regulator YdeE
MPRFSRAYLEHVNQGRITNQALSERQETNLVGLMVEGNRRKSWVWENLKTALEINGYKKCDRDFFRVQMILNNEVLFSYVGIEAVSGENPMPPLTTLHLPAGPYAGFKHHGKQGDLSHSLDFIYHTWLRKSTCKIRHPLEVEIFPSTMITDDRVGNEWELLVPVRMEHKKEMMDSLT